MTYNKDEIDQNLIRRSLTTHSLGKRIFFYEQVDSTNTQAKRLIKEVPAGNSLHGAVILAEEQLSGRGRLGRDWSSPKNGGIWMSFILNPDLSLSTCTMLTLVAALAVNEGIRCISGLNSLIKWPNDIVINGKKVCGILTESMTGKVLPPDADRSKEPDATKISIILGIGVNANRREFAGELYTKATSLSLESERDINRSRLIAEICNRLESYYDEFVLQGDLSTLKAEYEKYLVNKGKEVLISKEGEEYQGIALGINQQGALLVKTKQRGIVEVVSGEVSVRGVLGYV